MPLSEEEERCQQWGGEVGTSRSGLSHSFHGARLPAFGLSLVMGTQSASRVSNACN